MDLAHLLSRQKGLAELAQGIIPTSPLMDSLQKRMAEAASLINSEEMQKHLWEIKTTGDLLRVRTQTADIYQQMQAAVMKPFHDPIRKGVTNAIEAMQVSDSFSRSMETSRRIIEEMRPLGMLAQFNATSAIIEQLLHRTSFLKSAETYLLEGPYPNLARALDPLRGRYNEWTNALQGFDSLTLQVLSPVVAIPSKEYFHAIDSLRPIIGVDGSTEIEEQWRTESEKENDLPEFEELLKNLSPDLREMWAGATQALEAKGPDYQRHVTASLREFFDHFLLELAPNKIIAQHLSQRGEQFKGKAGWGLRLKVATFRLGQSSFTNFMEERVKIFIVTMDILQNTIHANKRRHSHADLVLHYRSCRALAHHLLEVRYLRGFPDQGG